jgi:hypothetical protein
MGKDKLTNNKPNKEMLNLSVLSLYCLFSMLLSTNNVPLGYSPRTADPHFLWDFSLKAAVAHCTSDGCADCD